MASSGPNNPGTGADDAGTGGFAWTNPGNILASDNSYATRLFPGNGATTHYLKATNFGFAIPAGATIDGIVLEIERKCVVNSALNNAKDAIVKLVKGGTVSGNDKADTSTRWPTSDTYATYGASNDLWGLSLTDSDVNSSTFGAVLSALFTRTGKINPDISVDHFRITVHYTASGGGGIFLQQRRSIQAVRRAGSY